MVWSAIIILESIASFLIMFLTDFTHPYFLYGLPVALFIAGVLTFILSLDELNYKKVFILFVKETILLVLFFLFMFTEITDNTYSEVENQNFNSKNLKIALSDGKITTKEYVMLIFKEENQSTSSKKNLLNKYMEN